MKPTPHRIIENFLPEEEFSKLEKRILYNSNFPWYLNNKVSAYEEDDTDFRNIMGVHPIYNSYQPVSPFYNNCIYLLDRITELGPDTYRALLRLRVNFYPHAPELFEHGMHVDFDFEHNGAILYLNTCDGYTKLEDGTKIASVRNRLLVHNPYLKHCSTNTTDTKARFLININYV